MEPDEKQLLNRGYELIREGFAHAERMNVVAAAHQAFAERYRKWVRIAFWFNWFWAVINLVVSMTHTRHQQHGACKDQARILAGRDPQAGRGVSPGR